MDVLFLGTGTSSGVPVLACDCPVCRSPDPRNRRTRASIYVTDGDTCLLVDMAPDFHAQALREDIRRVDAVLFTHSHADHIFGFDEIRRFNTVQNAAIPVHAGLATLDDLRRIFAYVEGPAPEGLYRPRVSFAPVCAPLHIGPLRITPAPVEHAWIETLGYRLDAPGGSVGYVPDCHVMPEASERILRGVDVLILDALRHRPHRTHLTVAESVSLAERIGARRSYLTHLGHDLDHAETEAGLPECVRLAHDGLRIRIGE